MKRLLLAVGLVLVSGLMEGALKPLPKGSLPDPAGLKINQVELARRLIEAFGSMKALVSGDWRTLEARIRDRNKAHLDHLVLGEDGYASIRSLGEVSFG